MGRTAIKESEAFTLTPDERRSFAGSPTPYRIGGPLRLVRLVQFGRDPVKEYWFEERVFNRLRQQATRDLLRQSASNKHPFARPLQQMVGMYMKQCLRSDLAICKNWTPNFDSYATLPLGPNDTAVAWVGAIGNQPYYSKPTPGEPEYAEKKAIYDLAESGGISLLATEQQYVIHFDFPANRDLTKLIQGPRPF